VNIIACVLKSGVFKPWAQKDYTVQYSPQHVLWLRDQFAAQLKTPHRFICLTDMEVPGVETRPLQDDLPGWWSKMELFREFDSAAYVDLSAVILNDVSPSLFSGRKFLMSAHMTKRHGVNSGVMSWGQSQRWMYDTFIADKHKFMAEFVVHGRWGDQDFIREHYTAKRGPIDKFQHYWPELILSYKHDILNHGTPLRFGSRKRVRLRHDWLTQPRIVKFHGAPKPQQLDLPWIPKLRAA
jgi:hypothetical protein